MKKLLTRTLLYLFIILLIPYSYFTWQAKKGVDAFLILHPVNGDFEYQWLWIDLEGKISLEDISFYQNLNEPVFTAETIEILLPSPFDILNSEDQITHREYPLNIIVNLVNGKTTQTAELFSLFGVSYQPEFSEYFYPEQCIDAIDKELPFINFELSSLFDIYRTADESLVNFSFKSEEFTNLTGKFIINNFSALEDNASFLSDLTLEFSDLLWMQQNTQKCLQALNLEGLQFDQLFSQFIKQSAKKNSLLLADNVADSFVSFIFVPQKVRLEFNLQEGKTFSQITLLPIYDYQEKTGLSVQLNDNTLPSIFQAFDYISSTKEATEAKSDGLGNEEVQEVKRDIYLSLNSRALTPHLNAKIEIRLYNGQVIVGYLAMANNRSIKISQLKYKGKTILPFAFKDIKSILLLRSGR